MNVTVGFQIYPISNTSLVDRSAKQKVVISKP